MYLSGTPETIIDSLLRDAPNLNGPEVARRAREMIAPDKPQLLDWQAVALFALAKPFNRCGAHILEIGTAGGFSAVVLSQACPNATVITLNPRRDEQLRAAAHLANCYNVMLLRVYSWDLLGAYHGPMLDMVWVDGDHARVTADIPWFRWVRPLGLLLFHDYSPAACPPVFNAVNEFGKRLGREPDVVVMDDKNVGMAGFYRREGDDGR